MVKVVDGWALEVSKKLQSHACIKEKLWVWI